MANVKRTTNFASIFLRIALSIAIVSYACPPRGVAGQNESVQEPLRVLFIGNSLTYSNEMPSMIEALAKASGLRRFEHRTIAFPNFSLEDHWNQKDALRAIRKAKWDFVVMQQGPSAGKEGRDVLLKYSKLFGDEIKMAGGIPAMYMVWPAMSRFGDFEGVSGSYKRAAKEIDALLIHVGDAMRLAIVAKSPVLMDDGFHPTASGSYLVALAMYEKFFRRTPVGLPSNFRLSSGAVIEISAKVSAELQRIIKEAY